MTNRLAPDQSKADDSPWLPPGFRFHPTDEELVVFYLKGKVVNGNFPVQAIAEVDLNKCEPWDLPAKAKMGEKEWYFFSLRDRKYPTGMRTNRATEAGYWKATGKDREVMSSRTGRLVGMKKTLVFYRGRAPKGEKTNWIMHEYRIEGEPTPLFHPKVSKDEWVVCRIFQKSAGGKKILMECHTSNRSSSYDTDPQARSSLPALLESPNPNSVEDSECLQLDGPRRNQSAHSFVHDALRASEESWVAGLKTEGCGMLDDPNRKGSSLLRCSSYLSDFYATADLGTSGLKGDILNEGYPKLLRQNSSFNLQQVQHLMSLKYLDHQSSPRGMNPLRPCKAEPYAGGEEDEAQGTSQRSSSLMDSWVADSSGGFSNGGAPLPNESGVTDLDNTTSGFLRPQFHRGVGGATAASTFIPDPSSNSTMDMADCLWAY